MILEWFNAQDAIAAGHALADSFLRDDARPTKGRAKAGGGDRRIEVQRLLQRAVLNAKPLKLNLFKRAKLLGAFKWRLIEQGFDEAGADELTHLLLLVLSGARAPLAESPSARPSAQGGARRRIDLALGAADAAADRGDFAEVVVRLQEVLSADPGHDIALSNLGDAFCFLGRYPEAERSYRRAVQVAPERADTHLKLGSVLHSRGDFAGAETALRRAVKLEPRSPNSLCALGHTLTAMLRTDDARICFEKALRLKPRSTGALCGVARLATMDGQFGDAETLLRRALEFDPECIEALTWLVEQRRMTPEDQDWLECVQRLLERPLTPVDESGLHFAMGKYFDDTGDYASAFEAFRKANEERKKISMRYDRAARTAWVDDVVRHYTAEHVATPVGGASDSRRPVFVVGMMRSGTTLIEQIIASHPRAIGAGELQFWGILEYKHQDWVRGRVPDPGVGATLAQSYLKELVRHSSDAERVIDKTPANVDYLGTIHRVLPNARFVYMQRDPVDTCLSCYFRNFVNAASFAMDLQDLAHYYREHHRLVAHWRSVLPKEVFLEVPYEGLVADPEAWSRRVLEFIGLEWDPKVLEFHKTERAVMTASHWQVRQAMYTSSVGRSKHYQKYIGPLLPLRRLSP
jgi:cytochrome c-type biogenesis protein CcmH/NrfG